MFILLSTQQLSYKYRAYKLRILLTVAFIIFTRGFDENPAKFLSGELLRQTVQ